MEGGIQIEKFKIAGGLKPINGRDPDDLFFACASFEPRSWCLCECMLGGYSCKRSAVYVNREFKQLKQTLESIERMEASLSTLSAKFDGVSEGSWEDASEQFTILRRLIAPDGRVLDPKRITLDITTFNREALFSALAVIRWAYPNSTVRLAYVSPSEYNPLGREELQNESQGLAERLAPSRVHEKIWLSRGFRRMRNAIGFPGLQKPSFPSLLVILPGYEIERPLTLSDELEPSIVLLGNAVDSTRDEFYHRGAESRQQMLRLFKSRQPVREFDFSCQSVSGAEKAIALVLKDYYDSHNVFLTSLSTKPTLVAAFLIAQQFDRVQVTFSVPREYNIDDYSSGSHQVSFYTLPSAEN